MRTQHMGMSNIMGRIARLEVVVFDELRLHLVLHTTAVGSYQAATLALHFSNGQSD